MIWRARARRVAMAAVLLVVVGACSDSGGGLCDRLAGTDFRSAEEISAVETEDGVVPSYEFIDFTADEAEWLYTDVVEIGEWTCSGDRVSFLDGRFEADILEENGLLVLDRGGVRYLEQS